MGGPMEVDSVEELVEARRAVFLARPRYAYFFVDPELAGFLAWGRIVTDDAVEGMRIFARVAETAPRGFLGDFGGVAHVDSEAARIVGESIERRIAKRGGYDLVQAVVHPAGLHGALVAGFFSVFPPGFTHRVFPSRREALSWLAREDAIELVRAIEARAQAKTDTPDEVRRLRELLTSDAVGAWTLDGAAQSLHVAKRTLQLRLEQAGTSFREELAAVRLALVKDRLRGEDKLLAIAIDTGFTSAQHFSRWFRSHTGMTPSEYRKNADDDVPLSE
jgi:AraC-like DNA-binding protein